VCLTPSRRGVGLLPPADSSRRSAAQRASADLGRSTCGPTLPPQGPPTPKDQRAPVRCPHPTRSPRWRRPDDHRGQRRRHRLGPPQRDRHGQAPMAECATRLELAGAVSPAHDLGWPGAVAAGAPRGASRHRRPAPCGPQCAPLAEGLRGLLPAEASASRPPHSPHRHGPQAGSAGLEPVATRQRVRPTGARCLRSAVPRAPGPRHGQAGQGTGLDVGAPRGAGILIALRALRILP
jgi:hypothetical protein